LRDGDTSGRFDVFLAIGDQRDRVQRDGAGGLGRLLRGQRRRKGQRRNARQRNNMVQFHLLAYQVMGVRGDLSGRRHNTQVFY
jgi:hypothetical protein